MGLLNYIGLNLRKTIFKNYKNNFSILLEENSGFGFLKSKKNDISSEEKINLRSVSAPIDDNELALNSPVQFINKFLNKDCIDKALLINPNIRQILDENHLPVEYNLENVKKIIMSHLIPTAKKAKEVYITMGHSKDEANYIYLIQAALLHDIGKIFIPGKILDKKSRLNQTEKEIVNLHSRLGYEIVKTFKLHPKVAILTLEHHNLDGKIVPNDENQILTMSDIYSALKENRPYKKALDDIKTIATMYDMATNKKSFNIKYMTYLKI